MFTCIKNKGSSVVDYCITSEQLFNQLSKFHVDKHRIAISDHCPIVVELPTGDVRENESNFENKPNILNVHTPTIVWDDTANVKYEHALLHREIQESLHEIETKILIDSKNIDDQVNNLNNIMMTAAKKSPKIIKHSHRRRPRKRANHIIKLNDTCKNLKRKLLSTKRLFLKYPQEPNVRGSYFSAANISKEK